MGDLQKYTSNANTHVSPKEISSVVDVDKIIVVKTTEKETESSEEEKS